MSRHFHEELNTLKQRLIKMGRLAQYAIENAMEALAKRNPEFALLVFEKEKQVNDLEIIIDDQGHSLLALAQPMAVDMRMITSILKINTDLERIADHGFNIAERVLKLIEEPDRGSEIPAIPMGLAVSDILKEAVESFVLENVELAEQILKRDDAIDQHHDSLYLLIEARMEEDRDFIKTGLKLARIIHDLERIGDLANNIAENVVYLKRGKEVRHHHEGTL